MLPNPWNVLAISIHFRKNFTGFLCVKRSLHCSKFLGVISSMEKGEKWNTHDRKSFLWPGREAEKRMPTSYKIECCWMRRRGDQNDVRQEETRKNSVDFGIPDKKNRSLERKPVDGRSVKSNIKNST